MERLFLFILSSLIATCTALGQIPMSNAMAEPPPNYLALDGEVFQDHISQIVHTKEIKEKICNKRFMHSSEVFVSLGRDRPFTRFERENPLCCDRFDIYLKNNEEIFFKAGEKYLKVLSIIKIGDEIFYEVVTRSGGKGKTSDELHCVFYYRFIENDYELVKASINEITEVNIKSL